MHGFYTQILGYNAWLSLIHSGVVEVIDGMCVYMVIVSPT